MIERTIYIPNIPSMRFAPGFYTVHIPEYMGTGVRWHEDIKFIKRDCHPVWDIDWAGELL
jgi:hypothetical protein